MAVLRVANLTHAFGGLVAVDRFELEVQPGEIHGLIGPNGAGKTTVFNLVTGVIRPRSGHIVLDGVPIAGLPPHRIARLGIARTFQNLRLFSRLTVRQNIEVVRRAQAAASGGWQVDELLERFDLRPYADQRAGSLPYGAQRRVEIARALATHPKLLLLDEPAAGMNPSEVDRLAELIRSIRDDLGVSIWLIEHQMRMVMELCDRVTVMNFGRIIARGRPAEIRQHPAVVEAYLGSRGAGRGQQP